MNRKERRQAAKQGAAAPAAGAAGADNPAALLREGLTHHQRGELAAAQQAYQRVLQIQPTNADALHLTGMVAYQVGEPATARDMIERAIKALPGAPAYHNNLGEVLRALDEPEAAVDAYRRAIELEPANPGPGVNLIAALIDAGRADDAVNEALALAERHPDAPQAQNSLGKAYMAAADPVSAADQFERAVDLAPDVAEARFNLGNALQQQGRTPEAVDAYLAAVELRPDYAEAHTNLGTAHLELGDVEAALRHLGAAVDSAPELPEAHFGLGDALAGAGRLEEAAAAYAAAVELDPTFGAARFNLAATLLDLGRPREAEDELAALLDHEPGHAHALNLHGVAAAEQGRLDGAIARYREAAAAAPAYGEPATNLGHALLERGDHEDALAWYETARELSPHSGGLALAAATALPQVMESCDQIARARARMETELTLFMDTGLRIEDPLRDLPTPAPRLLCHGENDRLLLESLAQAVSFACPELNYAAPHALDGPRDPAAGRLRAGFVVSQSDDHPIGRLHRGLMERLDRERFEVTVFELQPGDAPAAVAAAEVVTLPFDFASMVETVAAQELDILHFSELGADPAATCLGFARLAPVQCVGWGTPVTSGIATLDHFLSAADLEAEGAQDHYTETLVALDVPAVAPDRPEAPAKGADRSDLGLGDGETVYLCPQPSTALHPDLDPLLRDILAGDPRGVVALIEPPHPALRQRLSARLQRAMPEEAARIRFVPDPGHRAMPQLVAAADVVLDPPMCNALAALDALALGTPVVTLPGELLRARITLGWYRRLGVADWLAADAGDYVAKALALGTDPAARDAARARILDASAALFDDAGVRALEAHFLRAAGEAR